MASGTVRPLDHPAGVAAVLTLWSLGALALHRHVQRRLGVDLAGSAAHVVTATAYVAPALEILSRGSSPRRSTNAWRAGPRDAAPDAPEEAR